MTSTHTKKLYNLGITLLVIAGMFSTGSQVTAQSCDAYINQDVNNLLGYIVASDLPSSNQDNHIWVSSKDDPWTGGPNYGVSYDRDLGIFSGRGWNEGLRVWVDFDMGTTDEAQVLDSAGDPIGGFQWGYWNGEIKGVDNTIYSTNQGGFITSGTKNADIDNDGTPDGTYTWPYDAQYVSGSSQNDTPVGMGQLDFSQVVFDTSSANIPSECREYVDVLADGKSSKNLSTCSADNVTLTWNSKNIDPGSCTTVSNGAPWVSPGARQEVNLSGENSGTITGKSIFGIRCLGSITGNQITGNAAVTCGPQSANDDDTSGSGNNFEYIES